eukprot:1157711-Pelagomonas_calceolata.AAC.5
MATECALLLNLTSHSNKWISFQTKFETCPTSQSHTWQCMGCAPCDACEGPHMQAEHTADNLNEKPRNSPASHISHYGPLPTHNSPCGAQAHGLSHVDWW